MITLNFNFNSSNVEMSHIQPLPTKKRFYSSSPCIYEPSDDELKKTLNRFKNCLFNPIKTLFTNKEERIAKRLRDLTKTLQHQKNPLTVELRDQLIDFILFLKKECKIDSSFEELKKVLKDLENTLKLAYPPPPPPPPPPPFSSIVRSSTPKKKSSAFKPIPVSYMQELSDWIQKQNAKKTDSLETQKSPWVSLSDGTNQIKLCCFPPLRKNVVHIQDKNKNGVQSPLVQKMASQHEPHETDQKTKRNTQRPSEIAFSSEGLELKNILARRKDIIEAARNTQK